MNRARLIYDVGMNTGEDTARYLAADYRVVGIEADPILCEQCRKWFQGELATGQLTILEVAIAPQTGPTILWRNRTKLGWSSIEEHLGMRGRGGDMLQVDGMTFEEILIKHNIPWYLKSDIEGADWLCLEALKLFKKRPEYVSVELANEDWPLLLKELGYNRFALVNQAVFNADGISPDLPEVSGPLPTEIKEWEDLDSVMEKYFAGRKEAWYDIYATKTRRKKA